MWFGSRATDGERIDDRNRAVALKAIVDRLRGSGKRARLLPMVRAVPEFHLAATNRRNPGMSREPPCFSLAPGSSRRPLSGSSPLNPRMRDG